MNRSRFLLAALAAASLVACDEDPTAPAAQLSSATPTVNMGRRSPNQAPVVMAIVIRNIGGSPSPALSATISGAGAAGFSIDAASSTCIGHRLGAGESCTVTVSLGGLTSGPVAATLRVGGGDEEAQTTVALSGVLESLTNVIYQGSLGHGTVTESAHGTSCVATCQLTLDVKTVTLTALPDDASTFAGWTGAPGCATSSTCTLTLIDLNSVTVRFDPK